MSDHLPEQQLTATPPIASSREPVAPTGPRAATLRRYLKRVLGAYLRFWHQLEIIGLERVPPRGPAIVLTNHASLLDVPVLMVVDPYPNATLLAKASLFKIPVLKQALRAWGAIPVERAGRDTAGIRALKQWLRDGGIVTVAVEGQRTRSGRLLPVHPVLARIVVAADVPLIPIGISGSYDAMPPGAIFPRRRRIVVRIGSPFRVPRGTSAEEASQRIRAEIAALLPPEMQPLDA